MMKKLFAILMALSLCGAAIIYAVAGSGRESTMLPPQEVKIMYSSETYSYQVRDTSDNVVYSVDQRGQNQIKPFTRVDLAGTSYYVINKNNGADFWIDDHASQLGTMVASGVSILLPKITSAYNNYTVKIFKAPVPFSGTTVVVISTVPWVSGTTDHVWNVTTGVTYQSAAKVMCEIKEIDAAGDWLEFKAFYSATGSTWYQVGRYIQ